MRADTPVIVGVGQHRQRPAEPLDALEPAATMAAAARSAIEDAGAPDLSGVRVGVYVVDGAWPYHDPGRIAGEQLGLAPVATARSAPGGQAPLDLLGELIADVAAGRFEVGVLVGAEAINSRRRARRRELRIPYTRDDDRPRAPVVGPEFEIATPAQTRLGLADTPPAYAMFENALQHAAGTSPGAHRTRIARLWAGFNEVARTNPYAWSPEPMTASLIETPSPDNRMVAWPYTKFMCANWNLDLAAAVLVTTAATARCLGVSPDRVVAVHALAHADEPLDMRRRRDFVSSPAIGAAARAALGHAALEAGDVELFDLYSCYPSAVEIAAAEIGTDPFGATVTGGLTFAGGPLNNYVTHALAAMVGRLRSEPRAAGLVTANGGYLTKHAVCVLGGGEPARPFRRIDARPEVAHIPTVEPADDHTGSATVETFTVAYNRDGATTAFAALRLPSGARLLARNDTHPDLHRSWTEHSPIGFTVTVSGDRFCA